MGLLIFNKLVPAINILRESFNNTDQNRLLQFVFKLK